MEFDAYAWVVLAPLLGLLAAVLLHLLLSWAGGEAWAYRCALLGVFGGALAALGVTLAALAAMDLAMLDRLALLAFNLVIYAALGFGYVNFVGLGIASLRLRILQELFAHPEGLSREMILARYQPREIIDNRITRLTSGRQLVEREGRFFIERRGVLRIARFMNFLKWAILASGGRKPPD